MNPRPKTLSPKSPKTPKPKSKGLKPREDPAAAGRCWPGICREVLPIGLGLEKPGTPKPLDYGICFRL